MPEEGVIVQNLAEFKKNIRLLVVDDEESLRGMLSETLSEHGLIVSDAASGEEALEKFKTTPYHVVLTDIRMAGISGIEMMEAIKKSYPDTEVIVMTSHASMDTAVRAIRAGAYDYLLKPFDNLDNVTSVVDRVLEKMFLVFENRRLIHDLTETNFRLVEKNKETQTLYNYSKFLTQTLDMNEVLKLSLSCFSQLGGGLPTVFLAYLQGKLVVASSCPEPYLGDKKLKAIVSLEKMSLDDILGWFHRLNEEEIFKKTMSLHFQTGSFFAAPLFTSNHPFGVLVSLGEDGKEYPPKMAKLLHQFSQMVSVAVENASLHKQMKDFAIKDGLTGLFNHRYFRERLGAEISRAVRHQHPVSLIFIDVDHFKKFNDTNGHPMGDMVLKGVANIILGKSRKSDVVARYGGEEFVVILPETPKQGAQVLAEELRKAIEDTHFQGGETQPMGRVSGSFGVAEYPSDARDEKKLVEVADQALYHSKENGRNRVTLFGPQLQAEEKGQETKEVPGAHA